MGEGVEVDTNALATMLADALNSSKRASYWDGFVNVAMDKIREGGDETELLQMMGNSMINKILAPQTFALKDLIRDNKIESLREFLINFENHLRKNIEILSNSFADQPDNQNRRYQTPPLSQKS